MDKEEMEKEIYKIIDWHCGSGFENIQIATAHIMHLMVNKDTYSLSSPLNEDSEINNILS